MCSNPRQTVLNLMAAIEPTIINLGTNLGISNTPAFQTVITEYNNVVTALTNWAPGNVAQDVIQVINLLETGVQALPIPTAMQTLVNIILAGIATVVGVVSANSTPTVPAVGDASPEETATMHQAAVIADTTAQVQTLVPGFKRSIWHSPQSQYKKAWNDAVDAGEFPASMKVA